jgi:hypothetical protein
MENRNLNDGSYKCKNIISCIYIWNYMTIKQRNQILNDSRIIDKLCNNYIELANLIEKFSKSKWKDLPKELRNELKNFGYDFELYKKFLAENKIYITEKREAIKIIKRINNNA